MSAIEASGVATDRGGSLYAETAHIRRRKAAERRFRAYGLAAVLAGLFFLVWLLSSIIANGASAFLQTEIDVTLDLDPAVVDPPGGGDAASIMGGDRLRWGRILNEAMAEAVGVDPSDPAAARTAGSLLSRGASIALRDRLAADPSLIGRTVTIGFIADGNIDAVLKGSIDPTIPESQRQVTDAQLAMLATLQEKDAVVARFNWGLLTFGASSRPETAGVGVALIGSAYMMLIVLCTALPIGVAAAIYLEEFAPKNRLTDIIEVNISNLAAVPSIVFGILGLAVFINYMGLPRSAPLVGGLVLSLMTLPTIIISARAAIRAVPPSIREAALGVGASKVQAVTHHVLPLAAPGILTGTIIGLAQALGETAPLLMIGMVAFVADFPSGVTDPATALPVQIFMWSNSAERAFVERTSAAIIVLLIFMVTMNLIAIILRRRFERRW